MTKQSLTPSQPMGHSPEAQSPLLLRPWENATGTRFSSILLEEFYGHLLLYICALQGCAKLLKTDHLVPIFVCLHDSAFSNTIELIITEG